MFAPEAATLLINAGFDPRNFPNNDPKIMIRFQDLLMRTQMRLEETFSEAIAVVGGDKRTILYDRGFLCAKPYFPTPDDFEEILRKHGWDEVMLRDRYDGVLHLVTAAKGAEPFYGYNNPARRETLQQARDMDDRSQAVWLGNPHLRVIDNSTDFAGKLNRVLREIQAILGIPVAKEIERKFKVLNPFSLSKIPVPYQVIDIEQFYLCDHTGQEVRVRRRSQINSGACYYKTIKFDTGSARTRLEIEDRITELEYYRSLINQRPDFYPVRKQRVCFLWKNQYFELDFFVEPIRYNGLTLLEIELTEENDIVSIPDWLGPVEEVTEDSQYKNSSLARHA